MDASTPAIDALGLTRRSGDATVLDAVDLQVGQGEVVALLGPNGAGKTTAVTILSTLIRARRAPASPPSLRPLR